MLVIDDSEIARQAIARVLTASGFEVHVQEIAVGAISSMKRLSIDVAVVDVHLPQIMGDQFVALVRKTPALDNVRVVMITGQEDDSELASIAAKVKADAIVPKSRLAADLAAVVRDLAASGASSGKKRCLKVLIIDDDAKVARTTSDWLTTLGHQVRVHDRPLGALAAVMSQRPNVVLLEVTLPMLGGEEIANVLRRNRLLTDVHVIFHSALAPEELSAVVARSHALGAIRKEGDARTFAQQFKELTSGLL